ncbi:MAG: hypothetical protein U9P38_06875 [Campylobacterota bacterium]|nr:hypothetical protein [Campylobacterota bacterium]
MDDFLTYAPLVIVSIGVIHYTRIKMKGDGVVYTLLIYLKWFIGVGVTMFAFYVMMISGEFMKEQELSAVFSLPIGAFVWFIPMHYSSQFFNSLELKFKK